MYDQIEVPILEKISKISAKHRSILFDFLGETERNTSLNFTRIYPAPKTDQYDKFFESERPVNKLVYKYLYMPTDLRTIIECSKFNDLGELASANPITTNTTSATTNPANTSTIKL